MAFAALVLASFGTLAMAADSSVGTWKLNLAKSQFITAPAPRSRVSRIEAWGTDGVKVVVDEVNAIGKASHSERQYKYDGKFAPIEGNPGETSNHTRIDPNTVEITSRLAGKTLVVTRDVVSADGKTRTVTRTGTDSQGQNVHTIAVFDKQ
jgi:hypothetical protein